MFDQGFDLGLEIARAEVVFERGSSAIASAVRFVAQNSEARI
jgi:hypothetical protein